MAPNELIHALLKMPVDLFWNGGIGTYVKASSENHSDIGDPANDNLRVNGNQLGAKVIGEGGNLGFSQHGRIEFAQAGGYINTDAIDHDQARASAFSWAASLDVPMVDIENPVLHGLSSGDANPDGMHWSWYTHEQVGFKFAGELTAAISREPRGRAR